MPTLPPRVDGQAVVEGVMLRTAEAYAVAVRRPTGEIVVRRRALPPPGNRFWLGQLPLLRGLGDLLDHLYLGTLATWFSWVQGSSAALATADVGAEQLAARRRTGASVTCLTLAVVTLALPLAFVVLPAALAALAQPGWQELAQAGHPQLAALGAQLTAAVVQAAFLPLYLAGAALLPPLRRLCGYHGAEHKVRAAHGRKLPLRLATVRKLPAQAANCNMRAAWTFAVTASVVFAALPGCFAGAAAPILAKSATATASAAAAATATTLGGPLTVWWPGVGLRLVALVPILAIHGELARLWRRQPAGARAAARRWPFWTLTVREPDDGMLEVALAAIHALLAGGEVAEGAEAPVLGWRPLQGALPAGTPSARQVGHARRQALRPVRAPGSAGSPGAQDALRSLAARRMAAGSEDLCCTN